MDTEPKPIAEEKKKDEPKHEPIIKCKFCDTKLIKGSQYCHYCGGTTMANDPKKLLGVDITDEDILDYMVEGRITKTVKIGKSIKAVIQTMTTAEFKEMHVAADSNVATSNSNQTYTIEIETQELAYCLVSLGGKALPTDHDARMDAVGGLGKDLFNILLAKTRILHMCVGQIIQEEQVENF